MRAASAMPRAILGDAGVGLVKGMTMLALRFTRIHSGRADTAQNVHSAGHWFEMRGIDAATITAEMVQGKAIWYRSDQQFVSDAMGAQRTTLTAASDLAVTVDERGRPQPTRPIASRFIDLGPEAFSDRLPASVHRLE